MKILLVITSLGVGGASEISGGSSCYWLKGNPLSNNRANYLGD